MSSEAVMKRETSPAVVPFAEMRQMGECIARSGLFGMKTPEQAVALMLVAQAENRHPASAAMEYHIVDGRPTLKADAMLARFQAAGGKIRYTKMEDDCVSAVFSHPLGGELEISWDMEQAKKAGLAKKGNWTKYPRQMLRSRCISEGVRAIFPSVCCGVYTPEEAEYIDVAPAPRPAPESEPIEVPAQRVQQVQAELVQEAMPASDVPPPPQAGPVEDDPEICRFGDERTRGKRWDSMPLEYLKKARARLIGLTDAECGVLDREIARKQAEGGVA